MSPASDRRLTSQGASQWRLTAPSRVRTGNASFRHHIEARPSFLNQGGHPAGQRSGSSTACRARAWSPCCPALSSEQPPLGRVAIAGLHTSHIGLGRQIGLSQDLPDRLDRIRSCTAGPSGTSAGRWAESVIGRGVGGEWSAGSAAEVNSPLERCQRVCECRRD